MHSVRAEENICHSDTMYPYTIRPSIDKRYIQEGQWIITEVSHYPFITRKFKGLSNYLSGINKGFLINLRIYYLPTLKRTAIFPTSKQLQSPTMDEMKEWRKGRTKGKKKKGLYFAWLEDSYTSLPYNNELHFYYNTLFLKGTWKMDIVQ